MNKKELIEKTAQKAGKSQKEVKETIDALLNTIGEALQNGENVTLIGFGTFDILETKARTGRNPRTGEPLKINAKKRPRFKAGSELTDKVN